VDDNVIDNDPLIDGMRISVRFRRDFLVIDAAKVLAAGRRAFLDLNPTASEEDAEEHVTCAADAVFALLDRDGITSEQDAIGLAGRGYREQLTFDDPHPLPHPPSCFEGDADFFALPPSRSPSS
jgi:hypothetical protein